MKKPTAVKIVEALGWAYVVLAALAWLGMALSYLRSTCFVKFAKSAISE